MKVLNSSFVILLMAVSGVILQSCSKGGGGTTTTVNVDPNNLPNGNGSNSPEWTSSGQTVDFKPVSLAEFNSYVGTHALNDPTDIKINITLNRVENTLYHSGSVKIGYNDAGNWYQGTLESGSGKNVDCSQCKNNGEYEAKYNYFYNSAGKKIFSGFFQDKYGAIILVLEPSTGSGDGDGGLFKGTVFYRNFAQSLAAQSPYRKCWFITAGPYVCYSVAGVTKSGYTAFDGFTKLGTFTGIDLNKILGNQ